MGFDALPLDPSRVCDELRHSFPQRFDSKLLSCLFEQKYFQQLCSAVGERVVSGVGYSLFKIQQFLFIETSQIYDYVFSCLNCLLLLSVPLFTLTNEI
jgi:hypothetical protein